MVVPLRMGRSHLSDIPILCGSDLSSMSELLAAAGKAAHTQTGAISCGLNIYDLMPCIVLPVGLSLGD